MAELLGTVRRALRVLDYLAACEEPVAIKRLSSAYHVMNTLASDGYVSRDERSGGYGLGAKVARLGDAYARSWPVEPELRALVGELGARTGVAIVLGSIPTVLARWRRRPSPQHAAHLEAAFVSMALGGLHALARRDGATPGARERAT